MSSLQRALAFTFSLVLGLVPVCALGQYPQKPVRILVGSPPGGLVDQVARIISEDFGRQMGQPFVVENRPGAFGRLAIETAKRSAPDGVTLLLVGAELLPSEQRLLRGGQLSDFEPIAHVATIPVIVTARSDSRFKTLREVTQGQLRESLRIGAAGYVPLLIARRIRMVNTQVSVIDFQAFDKLVAAATSGETELAVTFYPTARALADIGKLRILATTNSLPAEKFKDVPTISNVGLVDVNPESFVRLLSTAHTPREVSLRMNSAVNSAINRPEINRR